MKEVGIVEEIDREFIRVRVAKKSACGENCVSCRGGCVPTERIISVKNTVPCDVGDKVVLEIKSERVIGAAFLVYIVPLLSLFLGYFLGDYAFKSEGKAVFLGVILMALSVISIRIFDKKSKDKFMARVTEIINKNANDF